MKSKIFLIVMVLAVVLLAMPYIKVVNAGIGENKLDFLLHMVGHTDPPPENVWLTDGGTRHVQGLHG